MNKKGIAKKMSIRKVVIVCIIGFVLMTVYILGTGEKRASKSEMKIFNNDSLNQTIVSPYLDVNIESGDNIVYCMTFQLAWNELKELVGDDIKLSPYNEIYQSLNDSLVTKGNLSEEYYVAKAGLIRDGIEDEINNELSEKFENKGNEQFDLKDDDILAYSYLYKELKFDNDFESLKNPISFTNQSEVSKIEGFGIKKYSNKHNKLGKQVDIIDYQDDQNFIIRLKSNDSTDSLILAKVKPDVTMKLTYDSINERVSSSEYDVLREADTLQIPKLSFDIEHKYTEMLGAIFTNKGYEEYFINESMQQITFILDEKGAILESKAKVSGTKSSGPEYRSMIFDSAFMLYMIEDGAEFPYLCMWIDNTELLVSSN